MATAKKILEVAREELGEHEYPPASNNVKYNSAYYGRDVSGSQYAWCAAFVWWCFREAKASALYYGGQKTAYCPTLLSYHKSKGQAAYSQYKPGDIIFFNFDGGTGAKHVGICESWDGTYITTIDGNTGTGNEANGGAVMRRKRHKRYIVGAYRPAYTEEELELNEETIKQIRAIVRDECSKMSVERAALPIDGWAVPYAQEAIDTGLMVESKTGTIDRPKDYLTRQEAATIGTAILKAAKK